MVKLFSLLLTQAAGSQDMTLSSCDTHALWMTLPLPKDLVQNWIDASLDDDDKGKVTLDQAPGFGWDVHPVQIEFDNFGPCDSFNSPIPFPDFKEVATQVPFVRWQGESSPTGFHFQPWAIVDNLFGKMAMLMLGAGRTLETGGDSSYPDAPGDWSHSTNAKGGGVLSLRNAHVEHLQDSSALADVDPAWRDMLTSKRNRAVTYAKSVTGKKIFACNKIIWDVKEAAKVVSGELETAQGEPNYFPKTMSGSIPELKEQFPGFEVYAVRTKMTAQVHCDDDTQVVV